MKKFISSLKNKSVHVVGVTGAEGSNILKFLIKHNVVNITAHDYLKSGSLEKSFKLWHKGIDKDEKLRSYKHFLSDLSQVKFYSEDKYLTDIKSADIIFVPQSWRLYPENIPLKEAGKKGTPFYSLTRLYLDFCPAKIIGVTGTVGKGSVANLINQLLLSFGKKVYFAGNDTWRTQLAEKLDEMKSSDYLVLEISHRQLLDGFHRSPHVAVVTNLYPNHLDEMSWEEYKKMKLSLVVKQSAQDVAVLNYDNEEVRKIKKDIKAEVKFYSTKKIKVNTNNVQKIFPTIMNTKIIHYYENILAALTVIDALGFSLKEAVARISKILPLPARLEFVAQKEKRMFYDDIKSTTPAATTAAVNKLSPKVILICGGKTKGIDYAGFLVQIAKSVKFAIFLRSQLSEQALLQHQQNFLVVDTLEEAVQLAYKRSVKGDIILVSPAAAFFYTEFIKGKKSLRKLVTFLLQEEQELKD